jgi:hypothetical protein
MLRNRPVRSCPILSGHISLSLLAALLSGCGGEPIPEEASDCPTQFGKDITETRGVEIGDASSGEFVPHADGAKVPLILGAQGSVMITPWIRVEAGPDDGEEACHLVRLQDELEGPLAEDSDALGALQLNVQFVKEGSFLVSDGALYHPFAWDREALEGQKMKLTAIVRGDGYEGTKSVNIVLE